MSLDLAEPDRPGAPDRRRRVADAVTAWQRHLADVGGRNTLLWYADQPMGTLDLTTAHPGGVSMLLAGRQTRLSDLVREPAAFAEARARVQAIRATATSLADQRGLTTGFLAVGMATWQVPRLSRSPQAPVLLRTCALRPTTPAARDFDVDLGDEVELNLVLEHYLRSEWGIDLDGEALADMASVASGFDPYPVYAALGRRCAVVPGFTIAPRLVVSTFAHSKLAMVADLAGQLDLLAGHDVVAALAASPEPVEPAGPEPAGAEPAGAEPAGAEPAGAEPAGGTRVEPDVDPDPDPAGERLVLDADTDQGSVVDAVRRGESLVVHAPPGTGATQTIANVVASLASEGRSVLLVAQQRAGVTDVVERLAQVGLAGIVFDASEAAVERRRTLERLLAVLDRVEGEGPPSTSADLERLKDRRDGLRDHVTALHEMRQPWGVSAHQVQWAIAELASRTTVPASCVRLDAAALAGLSRSRLGELAAQLTEAAELGAWSTAAGDPWYGATVNTDAEVTRARHIVDRLASGGFDAAAATLDGILAQSSLPPARTIDDWHATLVTMGGVRDTLEVFRPEVFDIPLDEHVAATGSASGREGDDVALGWWARSRVRRQARAMLRPGRPPEDLHAELVRARRHRQDWQDLAGAGSRPQISARLDEAHAAYDSLHVDLAWLGERLASAAAGSDLHGIPLTDLGRRLAELSGAPERLAVLPVVGPVIERLRAAGMGAIVDDFAARGVPAEQVAPEVEHIWWVSLAQHISETDPRFGRHDGSQLRRTVADYVATDHEHLAATASRIRGAADRAARVAVSGNGDQVARLRDEARRSGRPASVRSLFDSSSELLLALAPCWAMSPLTVAETVPPGQWFDVVVIDGAGQLAPAEAVSAMSRGRQVVVVGDRRQAPPVPFSTVVGAGAAPDEDLEPGPSVLDELAGLLPERTLQWQYGCVDERLVHFANTAAYAGSLGTFPGAAAASVVSLVLVDGTAEAEPGHDVAIESTDAEVERVVEIVLDHARARPQESLGVIALSERHAHQIRQAVAGALDTTGRPSGGSGVVDEDVMRFFGPRHPEGFFVRSAAEATGATRDAVVLAVGFGRTPHGQLLYPFPSISGPAGQRLLTTATTQARRRLTVVSLLSADDLDPERLRSPGSLMLRDLLDYARRGGIEDDQAAGRAGDPLMADLAVRLRREGLVVREDLGTSAHPVDLAVADPRDPGRFLVAVEGDGPGYAVLRGTRERDRLRVEQLERLGWRHVRIWSTDLYRDPAREVARVIAATRDAMPAGFGDRDEELAGQDRGVEAAGPVAGDALRPVERASRQSSGPDQSLDDTDAGWGERVEEPGHDRWLREQRPPHWE